MGDAQRVTAECPAAVEPGDSGKGTRAGFRSRLPAVGLQLGLAALNPAFPF